jgi:hypothetical protein
MRPQTVTRTNAGSSAAIVTDFYGRPEFSLQVDVVSGSPTWTVEQTLNDPAGASVNWFAHPDATMVAQTVGRQGNYAYPPRAVRLTVTGTGVVTLTLIQAGQSGVG